MTVPSVRLRFVPKRKGITGMESAQSIPLKIDVGQTVDDDISDHAALTATHGTTGDIVGTTDTQTLSGKTITAPDINGGTVDAITSLTTAGDVDIGSHKFQAETLESDVATGTAPMAVASTTVVTNLNADTVDGNHYSAHTKEIWVAGNYALGANATRSQYSGHPIVVLPDAVTLATVYYGFRVPNDFSSLVSGHPKLVVHSAGSGDARLAITANAGASGEALTNATDSIAEWAQAITANQVTEIDISSAFDGLSLAAGDQVGIQIDRDSDDLLDTLENNLDVLGIKVRY